MGPINHRGYESSIYEDTDDVIFFRNQLRGDLKKQQAKEKSNGAKEGGTAGVSRAAQLKNEIKMLKQQLNNMNAKY